MKRRTSAVFAVFGLIGVTAAVVVSFALLAPPSTALVNYPPAWAPQDAGTTEALWDVEFTDELSGWVVGEGGAALATTDGGATWRPLPVGSGLDLFGVEFVDSATGWVVGSHGAILATTDGGRTWDQQHTGDELLAAVDFADGDHGWAVGAAGRILATTDGGLTWRRQSPPAGASGDLVDVAFADARTGWAVGATADAGGPAGVVLATTDGGATWERSLTTPDQTLTRLFAAGPANAWAVGDDGAAAEWKGEKWSTRDVASGEDLRGVAFPAGGSGWVVGSPASGLGGGVILRSDDAGTSWSPESRWEAALHDVCFPSPTVGWAVGEDGTILRYGYPGVSPSVSPSPTFSASLLVSPTSNPTPSPPGDADEKGTSGWALVAGIAAVIALAVTVVALTVTRKRG